MGPSGSGKTTLLSILGGRSPRHAPLFAALACAKALCTCYPDILDLGLCMVERRMAMMGNLLDEYVGLASVPSGLTMTGAPTFNGAKVTKRAKRQVGFVLQVRCVRSD